MPKIDNLTAHLGHHAEQREDGLYCLDCERDEVFRENAELRARLEAVKALHFTRGRNLLRQPVCNECSPLQPMPCPTLRALSVAPQPATSAQPDLPRGPWIVKDDYVIALGEDGAPAILQVMDWGDPARQAALAAEIIRPVAPQPEPLGTDPKEAS